MGVVDHTPIRSPLGAFRRSALGARDSDALGPVPNGRYNDIAYGGGRFVAVGDGDHPETTGLHAAIASPDGIAWRAARIPQLYAWQCVDHKDGWFVTLGVKVEQRVGGSPYYGGIWSARSRNGRSWTDYHQISPTLRGAFGLVNDGERFFAICVNGSGGADDGLEYPAIASSVDGSSWVVEQVSGTACPRMHSIACGNGRLVASAGDRVYVSTNGENWSEHVAGFNPRPIVHGDDLFVAASQSDTKQVKFSTDGVAWHDGSNYDLSTGCMAHRDGRFIALEKWRTDGHRTRWSDSGVAWTAGVGHPGYWSGVCHGQGKLVAAGSGLHAATYGWRMIQYSPDGINWQSPRQEGDPNP